MQDTNTAPANTNTNTGAPAAPAMRLTGRMVRTLAALQALGATSQATAVTHNAIAAHTGAHKGNQLRPLYAANYAVACLCPGLRGYGNYVTPEGLAALAAAQAAPGAALQPAAPRTAANPALAALLALPPEQLAALLAAAQPEPAAAQPEPQPAQPEPAAAPARKGRKRS